MAEVAGMYGVAVQTLITAYQASGLRGIDDFSLLTPEQATSAAPALQRYKELKDPTLSRLRRNGHVPVLEFANDLHEPLQAILDICAQIGFPEALLDSNLWLYPDEQRDIRKRVEARKNEPVSIPMPASIPLAAVTEEAEKTVSTKKLNLAVNQKLYESTIEPPLIDFYNNNHRRLLSDRPLPASATTRSFKTAIGTQTAEIHELQKTLDTFSPASYGVFFCQMREALKVDERIQRSMPTIENSKNQWTDLNHAKFIHEVCSYKYGIFAYKNLGSKLSDRARNKKLPQSHVQKQSLHKFRPMHRGLLTDESRRQFILWRVGKGAPDFLVIKWASLDEWVDGMISGAYIGLLARYISTSTMLEPQDQSIVKLMIEMADDLRHGVHRTVTQKTHTDSVQRNYLAGKRPTDSRQLSYRAQSEWLVPITVSGRNAEAGLDAGFFDAYGGKRAHDVRSFYRRAPGSARNAPKDVLVQGHTRGGYQFDDAKLLPAVTITRPR